MRLLNNNGDQILIPKAKSAGNEWDAAHDYLDKSSTKAFVEPDIESKVESDVYKRATLQEKSPSNGYLTRWPQPNETTDNLVWYFNDAFSQLRKAQDEVIKKIASENRKIKIAIIDTGYQEGHPALPQFLNPGISFIKGETGNPAIDKDAGDWFEQNGHGTATMSILAGKRVDITVSGQDYKGYLGAIPFAEIIPIRISETVALIRTSAFVKAVEYAIGQGCEVISMSMAGAPTKAWATVVNKAYENGVVLVTAAGNSWYEGAASISPKRLLYPARWNRVIAATGVTYNKRPYVMKAQLKRKGGSGEIMQGNYGPKRAMKSALAAYTPNTTWATLNDKKKPYRLNGAGTSSATPQVAAAAALWLVYYRQEIDVLLQNKPTERWRKVEMVKKALFDTADKSYREYKTYFGQGTLKSFDALGVKPSLDRLEKEKEATVLFWGIADLLGLTLRLKGGENNEEKITRNEMFGVEILQEFHSNPALYEFLDDDEDFVWTTEQKEKITAELLSSPNISSRLKAYLKKE